MELALLTPECGREDYWKNRVGKVEAGGPTRGSFWIHRQNLRADCQRHRMRKEVWKEGIERVVGPALKMPMLRFSSGPPRE